MVDFKRSGFIDYPVSFFLYLVGCGGRRRALLISFDKKDFNGLKSKLGLTDGNLGAHLRVLEDAGYIEIIKGYKGKRPYTTCLITEKGREAFQDYLKQLENVINMARTENNKF